MPRALILALCLVVASAAHAHASPGAELDEARSAFRQKDCPSAVPKLKDLLYPREQLARSSEIVEAHAMLGACHCDTGQRDDAKAEFDKVLRLDPEHTLGELLFSSCALSAFNETRADRAAAAKRDADLRAAAEAKEKYEAALRSLVVYRDQPYVFNYLPGGAGQFMERRTLPGLLFATGEGLTLGVSGGIWLYLVGKYGIVSHSVALADGPRVRQFQEIEIGAGIGFILIYVGGVIDSLRHYEPRLRVEADESLLKDLDKKTKPPKKTSLRDRLHFGPIVTPSGLGIGLALEND